VKRLRILLVEPYFGGSHRQWAEGYRRFSAHDVSLLTLPARWWKWRMRGAAVTLAEMMAPLVSSVGRPDVMLVSDMVDLAALRTFGRPVVGDVPVALYCHETQLTYPDVPGTERDLSYAFTNWTSALAADGVAFNSRYHRHAFFSELPRLLRHFPDHTHEHRIPEVEAKSVVLPVGVDLAWAGQDPPRRSSPPLVLWNHRWEYDKGPVEFFTALDEVVRRGVEFEVAVCGERFRRAPTEFDQARGTLGERVVWWGFAERADYEGLLHRADVVVSTARQEFFGVAVVEAMAAGACPLLPDRLSYPELIPPSVHAACLYSEGELADRLTGLLLDVGTRRRIAEVTTRFVGRFDWSLVAPRYDRWLSDLFRQHSGRA